MRFCLALILASAMHLHAARKTLDMYFIDVEGGQATLIVSPSGQSLLVDTGYPGYNGRDADRIVKTAKKAGVKAIDYVLITHHHGDHVGGSKQLVERIPVKHFVDHGDNIETGKGPGEMKALYEAARASSKRLTLKPGDSVPVKGLDIKIVTARGERISQPLPGAGGANSLCDGTVYPVDETENARSLGFVLQFGKFRFIDLGDLTHAKEVDLVCPENRVGTVDVYLTNHHGLQTSNAKPFVHALKPRVAIMNNGAKKGGTPQAWQIVRSSPGLEDMWQVHFSIAGGKDNNVPESMIANLVENCEGHGLKLSAMQDGSFAVSNSRNKYEKKYPAR